MKSLSISSIFFKSAVIVLTFGNSISNVSSNSSSLMLYMYHEILEIYNMYLFFIYNPPVEVLVPNFATLFKIIESKK